jgi:sugar phosphate isomerase/epimerase
MPRAVLLSSGSWADVTLEAVAQQASEWGYQGLELCCWGDHFEVQRALSEPEYCPGKLELLARHDLAVMVLSNHRVGQAVCDVIDSRHQALVPDYVWGDGNPAGVNQRATEELMATVQAAEKLGVGVIGGFTGSPLWSYVAGYPPPPPSVVTEGLREFARRWAPILGACRDHNVKFAFEVAPGQMAFDLYSAEMVLDVLNGCEEFGFLFDPSHLHWQGVDPVEFLRRFPDRIYHVHINDATLTLNGRTSILASYLPSGDPRRGWDFRVPGHGGIDWEAVIRALNGIAYAGPLAVDFQDPGMSREYGADEACKFVKRLDFEPSPRQGNDVFRPA